MANDNNLIADEESQPKLVLASSSPRRLQLLEQIGLVPDDILAPSIDEAADKGELPYELAARLAESKSTLVLNQLKQDDDYELDKTFIIGADTVVAIGRRILPKAETIDQAQACLQFLSGRNHKIYTAISVIAPNGRNVVKVITAKVRFKILTRLEIESYISSGQWQNKAGGYAIQGLAGAFIKSVNGSFSTVMGLPLYETFNTLSGLGFPCLNHWQDSINVV